MKNRLEMYKGLGGFGTLGLEFVISILIGLFGGQWLDRRFDTAPWFMWFGLAFGIAMCVNATLRALKLMRADAEREEREHGNPKPVYETDADRDARVREEKANAEVSTVKDDA